MVRLEPDGWDVLVADDEVAVRQMLAYALESQGYRVQAVSSGDEAMNFLRSNPMPRLVILDVLMPRLSGLSALVEIRTDPRLRNLPVALLSGLGDAEDMAMAMDVIPDFTLSKPVDLPTLYRLTREACRRPERSQALREEDAAFFPGYR